MKPSQALRALEVRLFKEPGFKVLAVIVGDAAQEMEDKEYEEYMGEDL